MVMGIDMSKGKQVAVRLVHATSESPQSAWSALDTIRNVIQNPT